MIANARTLGATLLAAGLMTAPVAEAGKHSSKDRTTKKAKPAFNTYDLLRACATSDRVSLTQAQQLLGLNDAEVSKLKKLADKSGKIEYQKVASVFHASDGARDVQLSDLVTALKTTESSKRVYLAIERLTAGGRQLSSRQVAKLASSYGISETSVRALSTIASSVTTNSAGSLIEAIY